MQRKNARSGQQTLSAPLQDTVSTCVPMNIIRRVFWTFPFPRQGVDLAKNAGNPALFRLFFARLLEPAMSEKPYISRLFGVALIFLQELCLPALTFGVRKRKNIVHNIRGSDLGFVVQMAVNIRRCADIAVTEPFLYLFHRNIVCKKQ